MRLGIIGFPQSGKTTLFNALTRGDHPVTMNGGRFEVHTAVVQVPDPRMDSLVDMFHPEKITPARVTYADIAGVESDKAGKGFLTTPPCLSTRPVLTPWGKSPLWIPSCCSMI
jgi:ribosome-binding ATPase YchF (GTP1/OBG family)